MATRINRSATASNKMGGHSKKRNHSAKLYNSHESLDRPDNQEAFLKNRNETVSRRRNAVSNLRTDFNALGVPQGADFTPSHRNQNKTLIPSPEFQLKSPAFEMNTEIPQALTDPLHPISPPLGWAEVANSAEYVLVCEDINHLIEGKPFVHWLLYRIPASVNELPAGVQPGEQAKEVHGAPLQGKNSSGSLGYLCPIPPDFESWHHYRFRLYALEAPIQNLKPGMTWEEVRLKIEPYLLRFAELTGRSRSIRSRAI